MEYFFLALITFALGFVIGFKFKAIAKTNVRTNLVKRVGNVYVKDRANMPAHRQAAPPPSPSPPSPPPSRIIREGQQPIPPKNGIQHVSPGIMYNIGTFTSVNKCISCGAVGEYFDMHTINPCPICGGKVRKHGVAKWEGQHWRMSKA